MLSIITPVRNGKPFIRACLQNVIDQKCDGIEHIIIDGGSTDGTVEVVMEYAGKYAYVRWISEPDSGQSDAMNKGLAMARGSIVSFLNVDDDYEPGVLARVSELFRHLPEPSLLVGNCNIWLDGGVLSEVNCPSRLTVTDILASRKGPANPCAYFYHKSLHEAIGLYDTEDHYTMDYQFILRAVQVANVQYVNETWGNFHLYPGCKTYESCIVTKQAAFRKDRIIRKYLGTLSFQKKTLYYLKRFGFRIKPKLKRLMMSH
ncbi:glycosyltransferase [Candidatus Peregrinibacteria bacterium CG10_big_fil_rev_8_21_14_0_10_55_24]|nr:MAG: glycosyltransferase [Candidatus Peregrinibacteria bacterium CG10_big_fil_rev_8_21_14_0_10_55_24]